jgi:4-amino-4-deoxy-L-arabinose transferase-like glycosyltransferase
VSSRQAHGWRLLESVGLFVLALVPRLLGRVPLNNTDELLWIDRTINYWSAIGHGDWAGTLQSLHPGAFPPWGFGASLGARYGLAQLESWQAAGTLPMLEVARTASLFPILLTSATVVIAYHWLARLANRRVAWVAALMLALEPYFLTHSTFIHLDATVASLMFLAALAWLVYLLAGGGRLYLLLSGILTGLAVMTKIQAVYLVPYAVLAAGVTYLVRMRRLWGAGSGRELVQLAAGLGALLLVAVIAGFAVWPVLWVDARQVMTTVVERATMHLNEPHQLATYFMGQQAIADPGVLYYALTLAYRLRPLTLVFSVLSLPLLGLAWRRLSPVQRGAWVLGIAYPLFFFVQMSLGSQKMERYLLPAYPALVILAAVVLTAGVTWLTGHRGKRLSVGAVSVTVILLSWPWLRLAPYYSTYFNDLLGGSTKAVELFIVGGGEGLDLAAAYLNEKDGAEDLWALSYYPQVFMHYFSGHTQSPNYGSWSGLPVAADYMVLTSAQVQRGIYPTTLDFFLPREPEHVVRINGIDYAWVYRIPRQELSSPPAIEQSTEANFEHRVHLIGYDAEATGGELQMTLYWKLIVSVHEKLHVNLRLIDKAGQLVVQQSDPPWSGDVAVLSWPEGLAVRDEHVLPLPDNLRPDDYTVVVSLRERDENGQERPLKLESEAGTEAELGPIAIETP